MQQLSDSMVVTSPFRIPLQAVKKQNIVYSRRLSSVVFQHSFPNSETTKRNCRTEGRQRYCTAIRVFGNISKCQLRVFQLPVLQASENLCSNYSAWRIYLFWLRSAWSSRTIIRYWWMSITSRVLSSRKCGQK